MGLFSRRKPEPTVVWQPPQRPRCACTRHLDDDLLDTVVPYAASLGTGDEPPVTVRDLLDPGGLSVRPADEHDQPPGGPEAYTWNLGVYDDARAHYDDVEDGAELGFDEVLGSRHGIDEVVWDDREVFVLAAPTLCADGVLAAAALTLLDERVRVTD